MKSRILLLLFISLFTFYEGSANKIEGGFSNIKSIAMSADGKYLVYGGGSGDIIVWDILGNKPKHFLQYVHPGGVDLITISPKGDYFVSQSMATTEAVMWNMETGVQIGQRLEIDYLTNGIMGYAEQLPRVLFTSIPFQVKLISVRGTLVDWNPTIGMVNEKEVFAPAQALDYDAQQQLLAFYTLENRYEIYSWKGDSFSTFHLPHFTLDDRKLAMHDPNPKLISINYPHLHNLGYGEAYVFSIDFTENSAPPSLQEAHLDDRVISICPGPKGRLLAVRDDHGVIRVFEKTENTLKEWNKIKTDSPHTPMINDLSWTPDGKHLLYGDRNNQLVVWSVERGKQILTLAVEDLETYYVVSDDKRYEGSTRGFSDLLRSLGKKNLKKYTLAPGLLAEYLLSGLTPDIKKISEDLIAPAGISPGNTVTLRATFANTSPVLGQDLTFSFNAPKKITLLSTPALKRSFDPYEEKQIEYIFYMDSSYLVDVLPIELKLTEKDRLIDSFKIEIPVKLPSKTPTYIDIDRVGKDFALLFSIEDYDNWPDLKNPTTDAQAIKELLEQDYGFVAEHIVNPTKSELLSKLFEYSKKEFSKDGQLFIYFSGHGSYESLRQEGFLIPRDANVDDPFQESYLSHHRLEKFINSIPCNHILLGIDACYSGTFAMDFQKSKGTDSRPMPDEKDRRRITVQRMLLPRSKLFFTSGGVERTPDGDRYSPLTEQLLVALNSSGNNDQILTIHELRSFLETVHPRPRFGQFGNSELDGNFLFIRKSD